ncbi:MAG: aminomethyl-transferring glycine dehydrogenase [Bacteroidota bacterium]
MSIEFPRPLPFSRRHIGPDPAAIEEMLRTVGEKSLTSFIDSVVPPAIRLKKPLALEEPVDENALLSRLAEIAGKNELWRTFIGMGYYDTVTPAVILRNILENPGWYTAYTPYQAEIAQGRLEALLNYQTMVCDLAGMQIANASLLDEGTAAAEAMGMFLSIKNHPKNPLFFVADDCHPQTIAVVQTRARHLGVRVIVGPWKTIEITEDLLGVLVQYPATDGAVYDYTDLFRRVHAVGALAACAADLLALALIAPPGEFGADVALGSTQRFGVPMGFGGPHAAYFATLDRHKRFVPGRIIGVSVDANGRRALRMALQTREQHIRREKATSNICTAQVLLAVMAGMYAVWHGPDGLKAIAGNIHELTKVLATGLENLGHRIVHHHFIDTIRIEAKSGTHDSILRRAAEAHINFREYPDRTIGISLDETVTPDIVEQILEIFASKNISGADISRITKELRPGYDGPLRRTSAFLQHPVFSRYHSETEMLRYLHSLEMKDLSLTSSMIPLGSCTMKLNATTEMIPITWPKFSRLHPFVPREQARGYQEVVTELSSWLATITGFTAVSLQPNAGAQGEYTGLLVIRAYQESRGEGSRNVCLIPQSAHGTNPASAVMAGMTIVVVKCDAQGNIDLRDLTEKAVEHKKDLAALMITYPSTHGVFEEQIKEICTAIHTHGGQVYMDGANMNAQVGLCRPADMGADVCHINLHKTFCIPHGGGGPGMGPIAVAPHLTPFLPSHPVANVGGPASIGTVSSAQYGSADILLISWAYIALMGGKGLTLATQIAILNANYMAKRLEQYYPILYRGANGRVAHEFIVDLRGFKDSGVEAEDVAKRLMDYGFHAPTVSFPVAGTLMIEPTESESKEELDRFCEALVAIRGEIQEIVDGKADRQNNVLKNAPHTAESIASDTWAFPYGREKAAYPLPYLREHKFWPSVGRVNNAFGDRNLVCTCPPIEAYETLIPSNGR